MTHSIATTPSSSFRALAHDLDTLLENAVSTGAIPGAVVVVTGPEGPRYEGKAGGLRIDQAPQVSEHTLFRWASITKAVTSIAALQLVERRRLGLDTEVASILPKHAEIPVLEGFDAGVPRLRRARSRATIRQLLTHTAGHAYPWSNADLFEYQEATRSPLILSGRRAALSLPLVAEPGSSWHYGTSTDWLGQVVEEVSGENLGAYFAANIFAALGIDDVTFTPSAAQRSRTMDLHRRTPSGGLERSEFDLAPASEFMAGGHGLYGPARSFSRLLQTFLRGGEFAGEQILRRETVQMMLRDQLGGIALPTEMKTAMPELMNDLPPYPFRQGWGFGFHLTLEDLPGMRRAGTADWAGLFNSYYWIDVASGIAAALFTQVLPFFDSRTVELALAVERLVYQSYTA